MKRLPAFFLAASATASLALAAGAPGCANRRVHGALDFLFDGVPPVARADSNGVAATGDSRAARDEMRRARQDSLRTALDMTSHPPYAEGECTLCHNMPGKRTTGQIHGSMPSLSTDKAAGQGWLVMPADELCFECHDDKTGEYAEENGMMIHAPVEAGECIECHSPHRSRYKHLLLSDPVRTLCFKCHEESIAGGAYDHPELELEDHCTDCHNPHMSEDEKLLE